MRITTGIIVGLMVLLFSIFILPVSAMTANDGNVNVTLVISNIPVGADVFLTMNNGLPIFARAAPDGTVRYLPLINGTLQINVVQNGNIIDNKTLSIGGILPPMINSVTLNVSTPYTGDSMLVAANVTDNIGLVGVIADIYSMPNVGVSNVAVDHVILVQNGNMWSGTIVARSGTYSVNVSASDAAGNVAWNNSTRYTATDKPHPPPSGGGGSSDGGTYPTITPTPRKNQTNETESIPEETPVMPTVTVTIPEPGVIATEVATEIKPTGKSPGFDIVLAIGTVAAIYILRRNKIGKL